MRTIDFLQDGVMSQMDLEEEATAKAVTALPVLSERHLSTSMGIRWQVCTTEDTDYEEDAIELLVVEAKEDLLPFTSACFRHLCLDRCQLQISQAGWDSPLLRSFPDTICRDGEDMLPVLPVEKEILLGSNGSVWLGKDGLGCPSLVSRARKRKSAGFLRS